jgi:hypothetical protein
MRFAQYTGFGFALLPRKHMVLPTSQSLVRMAGKMLLFNFATFEMAQDSQIPQAMSLMI